MLTDNEYYHEMTMDVPNPDDKSIKHRTMRFTKVYEGNKDGIKFKNTTNSIVVNENAIDDFIDAADYAIIHFGMVNQDYLSDLGYKLQLLYDDIYSQTKHNS